MTGVRYLSGTPEYFSHEWETRPVSADIHHACDYRDQTASIIEGAVSGTPMLFDDRLSFRPGELSVWAGINGHGKSLVVGQIIAGLARAGERVCLMSFEMAPGRTIYRMLRQAVDHEITVADLDAFLDVINPYVIFYDRQGSISATDVLGAAIVAARDRDCTHVFIDNMMKVVRGETDFDSQKDFIDDLVGVARDYDCHVHLVHHVRKGNREEDDIDKFSVRGASSIVDQADNLILVQRNLKKERRFYENQLTAVEDEREPDTILRVAKQRNGDWTGNVKLWFDRATTNLCTSSMRRPIWVMKTDCAAKDQTIS